MADTASKHIDMTTGSLWRNIPLFAFPVAATSILEQLSNLIATVIIGNFSGDQGTLAMAAVGSNVPLTSLMLNLFIGMSLGSNVVIANAIGRNDQNMVKRAVHTSILMALVGFVAIALGEIFAEPMLAALNVPAETMGAMAHAIQEVAKAKGLEDGFRVISNKGVNAGQTVMHFHMHVLGGKNLGENLI